MTWAAWLLVAAPAAEPNVLTLCGEPTSDEVESAAELNGWLKSTQVRVEVCGASAPERRLSFVERDAKVWLQLVNGATVQERQVPWLDQSDTPLSRLRAAEALAKLSVLIEALLTEERLEPSEDSKPGPHRPRPAAHAQSTRLEEPKPPPPQQPEPTPPPAPIVAAGVAPESPSVASARPEERPWTWSVGVLGGWRLHTPDISSLEVGGEARVGFVAAGGFYDPRSVWSLGGVPVALATAGLDAGVHSDALRSGPWFAGWNAAFILEWIWLRRADIRSVGGSRYEDVGFRVGIHGGRLFGPLGAEIRIEGLYMPTGRLVKILDGPEAFVNRWGVQVVLSVFWRSEV
jgi:hypothetical protein